jgi:hypothetical protein
MEANELLNNLADLLKEEMRQQLRIANHIMTGDLIESIESRILSTIEGRKIEIWLNSYGIALDQGVPPDRIPFTEPSGRGGRSKYIEGLQRFAQLKLGVTDNRKSLGIAFAIARKHKKVGMPVKGPTQFIQKTIDATDEEIMKFAEEWSAAVFEAKIDKIIENLKRA